MSTPIRIKGYPDGLIVQYDESLSMDEIYSVTKEKFSSSRKFFGNSMISLVLKGRSFSEQEEDKICDIIMENSDLDIACIIKEDEHHAIFEEAIRNVKSEMERNDILFYNKSVINEAMLRSKKDIVIIGDVNPGCTIVSEKNIYIFGGLYGEAYAGVSTAEHKNENNQALIMAMEMAPEELKIGEYLYSPTKKSIWGIKPKLLPQIAYVSNDKINIEPYTKELLDRLI